MIIINKGKKEIITGIEKLIKFLIYFEIQQLLINKRKIEL